MMKLLTTAFVLLCLTSCSNKAPDPWTTLFNGEDLSGWTVKGTDATFEVGTGEVIGTNQGRQNTFLATDKTYGDFILELEVWVDPRMNSGIQFRSAQNETGRVYGYQAEIDPSERAYSGGIYDEARRDWLYPLSLNPAGQKAFKNNEWNLYRIEAIGTSVRIWVNGICTALLEDDASTEGFIALQVHGVGNKEDEGRQVKWRNVKVLSENVSEHLKPLPEERYQLNLLAGKLTEREEAQDWQLLWNDNERQSDKAVWQIKDGVISADGENTQGTKLAGKPISSDFEFSFQFKLGEMAECQVMYLIDQDYMGKAYQLVDRDKYEKEEGTRRPGALLNQTAPQNLSYEGMGERYLRATGQWNQGRVIVQNGQVQHWMNGFKIIEYDLSAEDKELEGRIVLNYENGMVELRSVKLRKLP